jgi:hypothetical protein
MKSSSSVSISLKALVIAAAIVLTACGGGSDAADEAATTGVDGVVTKQCSRSKSNADVTNAGCVVDLGEGIETLVCPGPQTVYRLAGAGHTRDAVLQSNRSYTAGGSISINGVTIRCV